MESAGTMPKYRSYSDVKVETVKVPEPESRTVVSALDAKTVVTGKYSGREYVFNGAGSIQNVDNRDVEWLLEKRQGKGCCGGGGGAQIFYLVEEN